MKFGFDIDYRRMMDGLESEVDSVQLSDDDLYKLGRRAIHMIKRRTQKGKDFEDNDFKPYSKKYAKYRDRKGRNTTPVDLLFEGLMLAGLTAVPDGDVALLRFTSSDLGQIANYHNSLEPRSKVPLRRFLDFKEGSDDYGELAKYAARLYAKTLGH